MSRTFVRTALIGILMNGSGCMHSPNRIQPGGTTGAFAVTRESLHIIADSTLSTVAGRTLDGETISGSNRVIYAAIGTAFLVQLPLAIGMDLVDGPTP
jgi:hypothetical protein